MSESKWQKTPLEVTCRSWVIYGPSEDKVSKIQKEIDNMFSDYSFYPEVDWGEYGYRPPEGHQVLGAWRHPRKAFVFLLENPNIKTIKPSIPLLLYVAGETGEISMLEPKIEALKSKLDVEEQKYRVNMDGWRLKRFSIKSLTVLVGVFAAAVHGLSFYLRRLPSPELGSEKLVSIYKVLFALVHYGALFLLLLVFVIIAVLIVKYGIIIVRRL